MSDDEREPEPVGPMTILEPPVVLEDADYRRLVKSTQDVDVVCIPRTFPTGIEVGAFVYAEGVTQEFVLYDGAPHRVVAFVVSTKRAGDEVSGRDTMTVALRGIALLPKDGMPRFRGPLHWH